jgi:hypothetical protein
MGRSVFMSSTLAHIAASTTANSLIHDSLSDSQLMAAILAESDGTQGNYDALLAEAQSYRQNVRQRMEHQRLSELGSSMFDQDAMNDLREKSLFDNSGTNEADLAERMMRQRSEMLGRTTYGRYGYINKPKPTAQANLQDGIRSMVDGAIGNALGASPSNIPQGPVTVVGYRDNGTPIYGPKPKEQTEAERWNPTPPAPVAPPQSAPPFKAPGAGAPTPPPPKTDPKEPSPPPPPPPPDMSTPGSHDPKEGEPPPPPPSSGPPSGPGGAPRPS